MQIPLLSQMAAKSNQKLLYENELKDSHQSIYTLVEIPNFCSKKVRLEEIEKLQKAQKLYLKLTLETRF